MRKEIIKYIFCPVNHDDLFLEDSIEDANGNIVSGVLRSKNGKTYLINEGIPNFIDNDSLADNSDINPSDKRLTEPYNEILERAGINSKLISQMDALRYSIYKNVIEFSHENMQGVVLDLGAGRNYLKSDLIGLYNQWVSLDFDVRANDLDLQADGQMMPLKSNIFDTVISIDVLEHVPSPERFVSEIFRVLKPGGKVILSTPFFFYLHEEPYDYFRFSRYGLKKLFGRNGFEVLEIVPIAGAIAIFGLLISVAFTRIFSFSNFLIRICYSINKFIQLNILLPLDKKIDKRKRFAQGHFIIARKFNK